MQGSGWSPGVTARLRVKVALPRVLPVNAERSARSATAPCSGCIARVHVDSCPGANQSPVGPGVNGRVRQLCGTCLLSVLSCPGREQHGCLGASRSSWPGEDSAQEPADAPVSSELRPAGQGWRGLAWESGVCWGHPEGLGA